MSKQKPYLVGWVRKSARHPLGPQLAKLREAGVEKVYGSDKAETVMDAIKHISGRGQSLIVVTSLARLGSSREAVRQAVAETHERGGVELELGSGRRSDDASVAVQMALDAADEIAADHRAFSPREARAAAAKRWMNEERPPRTSIAKAKRIWRDKENYPKISDALRHPDMAGWRLAAIYKEPQLGRRHPANAGYGGRPRKPKPENT